MAAGTEGHIQWNLSRRRIDTSMIAAASIFYKSRKHVPVMPVMTNDTNYVKPHTLFNKRSTNRPASAEKRRERESAARNERP